MSYRSGRTIKQISDRFRLSLGTTIEIVKKDIPEAERREIKARNYAASKIGDLNPAYGKKPQNYVGDCSDHHGYLTRVIRGKRYFSHRIVMAEMIGIPVEALPSELVVHHINGDPTDNRRDNLALATSPGHFRIHSLQR